MKFISMSWDMMEDGTSNSTNHLVNPLPLTYHLGRVEIPAMGIKGVESIHYSHFIQKTT